MATLEKIGKYEILEKIGEGGFGVVYKGKDPFIKRLVAVKTCSSENESIQKRFFREAEIAGNLHHANVVTIHDFGVEGETPYLVQEFLTGEDLDVLIGDPNHHLSLPTKVRYLRGISEGLRYAHAQGVIHRDIKPSNIRILENHRVKVMDFGIAKLKDQESQLTQTGMALGTVAYMSPEQLKGEKVDHRVDIFSFGVLAYELLVGKRPFHAESVSTLFYQLLHEDPPAIEDAEIPAELKAVVVKCLAKTLDVRYKGFDDVLADLESVQSLVGDDQEAITDDPFSDATSSATRLVAKTARSIEAGDLTAAEQTLAIARRECDRATFDREFAPLVAQLAAKRSATAARATVDSAAVDLRSEIAAIDAQLQVGRTDTAAVAFTALEFKHPQHPDVAALRQRVAQAFARSSGTPVPPPMAGPPASSVQPIPEQPITEQQVAPMALAGAAARQRARTGPLVAALAAVVLLGTVGAIFLAQTLLGGASDDSREGVEDTVTETPGDPLDTGVPGEPGDASEDAAADALDAAAPSTPADADDTAQSSTDTGSSQTADAQSGGSGRSRPTPTSDSTGTASNQSGGSRNTASQTRPSTTTTQAPTSQTSSTSSRPSQNDSGSGTTSRPTVPASDNTPTRPNGEQAPQDDRDSTPTQTPSTPTSGADDSFSMARVKTEAEITSALGAWKAAWESRDHNAVNRYHPGANVTRRDVRSYRTISVEIGRCAIDLDGDRASARCPITLVKTPGRGTPETVRYSSVELAKQSGRWMIAQLR
ncbi:MAG TPA: protein kinase [Thermoanaerobaculia bacterium]|nr:protein kinase [Thermoanaerobaculia bacterium]